MVMELIKPGYRKTEVGVIPDDWDLTTLDEKGIFRKGKGIKKDEVTNEGLPCIRYGEIYTHYNYYVNRFFSFIPSEVAKKSQKIQKDDLLFAGSGETAEEIGKCVAYLGDEDVYAGGDIIIFSPNEGNALFLGYFMNHEFIAKQKYKFAQGHAVVHIYATNLRRIILPFPKRQEQSAIAQVLSDTDNLIDSLNKLIRKKKNIKKGVMQELLSGNKKLPGFSGEWKTKVIGKIVEIRKGELITELTRIPGNIPVIAGGKTPAYYHNRSNRTKKTITISGSGANAGYVSFHTKPIFASDCSTIEEHHSYSIEYLYFRLLLIQEKIYTMQTGGAQPHIHPSDIAPLIIELPKDLKEQSAIAHVLSDIDSEIKEWELRRDKYKMIKEGLMQQLLTGKIRLK